MGHSPLSQVLEMGLFQGSALGPLQFLVIVNGLVAEIKSPVIYSLMARKL